MKKKIIFLYKKHNEIKRLNKHGATKSIKSRIRATTGKTQQKLSEK